MAAPCAPWRPRLSFARATACATSAGVPRGCRLPRRRAGAPFGHLRATPCDFLAGAGVRRPDPESQGPT
eukprot:6677131-Alexandrium_andersonii.AAC.1